MSNQEINSILQEICMLYVWIYVSICMHLCKSMYIYTPVPVSISIYELLSLGQIF